MYEEYFYKSLYDKKNGSIANFTNFYNSSFFSNQDDANKFAHALYNDKVYGLKENDPKKLY